MRERDHKRDAAVVRQAERHAARRAARAAAAREAQGPRSIFGLMAECIRYPDAIEEMGILGAGKTRLLGQLAVAFAGLGLAASFVLATSDSETTGGQVFISLLISTFILTVAFTIMALVADVGVPFIAVMSSLAFARVMAFASFIAVAAVLILPAQLLPKPAAEAVRKMGPFIHLVFTAYWTVYFAKAIFQMGSLVAMFLGVAAGCLDYCFQSVFVDMMHL